MNAAIEVGGGLQTLPKELRQGGNVWKALANSGIGEGKEEVFQGIVDRASQNLVYNKGNPLASLTDPNAVFSLPAAANEFTEGFAIGSILGGGQAGVLSAAQTMQGSPITSYAEAFRRFIGMNTEGTATSEITRYQELERKYLEGTLGKEEKDELWELERVRGQIDVPNELVENTQKTDRSVLIKDMTYNAREKWVQNSRYGDIIGTKTANQIQIKSISAHTIERAVQRGVPQEAVLDAINNPLHIGPVKTDKYGRKSQRFVGKNATVNINPETGIIATVWLTGKNTSKKYAGGEHNV